jgi:hypothetical protein
MSFIRPEAATRLRQWGEPLVSGVVLAFGLWLLLRAVAGAWLLALPGLALAVAGAGLLVGAVRRLRLGGAPPGEGVVVIDEGRIGYYAQRGGGFLDLPGLIRVEITRDDWLLTDEEGFRLVIPRGAAGAEALPDAFSPLPDLHLDAAAAALAAGTPGRTLVWRRPFPARLR